MVFETYQKFFLHSSHDISNAENIAEAAKRLSSGLVICARLKSVICAQAETMFFAQPPDCGFILQTVFSAQPPGMIFAQPPDCFFFEIFISLPKSPIFYFPFFQKFPKKNKNQKYFLRFRNFLILYRTFRKHGRIVLDTFH